MLFNTLDFGIFLPITFLLYWLLNKQPLRLQNLFLVVVSYIFYGWWDWRFLGLIAVSSLSDYIIGYFLTSTERKGHKRALLLTSIAINIGILATFKYFSFFLDSFITAFSVFGFQFNHSLSLSIVLPVGISFYTFQTLSYTLDVYKGKLKPTTDIISFFAFVSFFPQLVAGPIERARNLLPQFQKKRFFDTEEATDGLRQILWGLFKKVTIADACSLFVEDIFANHQNYSASTLLLGAFLFGIQIYCDFSGYSDIAIGTAKLMGFKLTRNFAYPYFSRDIAEFWRRWHISLSTWFRDYLYIPLGGSRGGKIKILRNVIFVFTLSGLWHGANWTFLAWGFLNALLFLPLLLFDKNRKHISDFSDAPWLPTFKEFLQIGVTHLLIMMTWIMFRSESLVQAFLYYKGIFSFSLFSIPEVFPKRLILLTACFLFLEWIQRNKTHPLDFSAIRLPRVFRWSIYYVFIMMIWWLKGPQQNFIYFQF